METEFEKVIRYRCRWCGKEFRTERHKCKFSPERKNCFSCKHLKGFYKGAGVSYGLFNYEGSHFICDKDNSGYDDFDDLRFNNWNGTGCEYYETMQGYKGTRSYAKVMAESNGCQYAMKDD